MHTGRPEQLRSQDLAGCQIGEQQGTVRRAGDQHRTSVKIEWLDARHRTEVLGDGDAHRLAGVRIGHANGVVVSRRDNRRPSLHVDDRRLSQVCAVAVPTRANQLRG
jgi:hypothetical protein